MMIRYRFFQVVFAAAVAMLILSSAVYLSFYGIHMDEQTYRSEMEGRVVTLQTEDENKTAESQLTEFEAWLEFGILADGLEASGTVVNFDQGSVKLCSANQTRLTQIKKVRDEARRMMFLSVILLVIGFLAVKRRRMYECVVWGGACSCGAGVLSFLLLAISRTGLLYGIREMVFYGNYDSFFSTEDALISLIPEDLARRMSVICAAVILAGLLITVLVRLISRKKTRPHRF